MASSEERRIVWAPVQRWNVHTVSVQCPFCTKIHNHGFGGSYSSIFRAPHCNYQSEFPSYCFAYPFSTSEGTVAYEIDKSEGFFVALGAESIISEVDQLEKTLGELNLDVGGSSDNKSWKQATEMITIGLEDETFRRLHENFGGEDTMPMKKLDHVLSRMISFGDCKYVEEYLQTSPEAGLFLLGIDDDGNSALNIAACEKYPAMIKLLLDQGAKPDHQNKEGRTPLMEAALWGRVDNVNLLLGHGADKKLRDIHGHQAANLAEPSLRNDEERYERSGEEFQVYRENTFIANRTRKAIFELLKDSQGSLCKSTPTCDRAFEAHSFRNTGQGTIQLIAPIAEFRVSKEWKTVASLQRPSEFPSIAAISGWGHGKTEVTVSGREWTAEVMRISSIVGHQLQTDEQKDQGKKGQYHASHAEKQLIAFFISKHVLIETEDDELVRAKPPVLLEQATILVSRSPCGDCSRFIRLVNITFGLMIAVLDRSQR